MGQGGFRMKNRKKLNLRQWKKNPWVKTGATIVMVLCTGALFLGCCMFYTTGSFKGSVKQLLNSMIENYSLSMVRSGSNVIGYLDYTQNDVEGGVIVQVFNQLIPLHTYIVNADDVNFDQYVQAAKAAMNEDDSMEVVAGQIDDFLYYNGNIYAGAGNEITDVAKKETTQQESQISANLIEGESYLEDETTDVVDTVAMSTKTEFYTLEQLCDFNFFIKNCYVVDSTIASEDIFNASKFMSEDLTLTIDSSNPQILIYHTHSQETFYDSREGVVEDSVVGVGEVLTQILTEQYGIGVIHDTTTYDLVDGKLDRSVAYNIALASVEKILQYNPEIEVVIDLHRDGLPEGMKQELGKRVVTIDGEDCAQIMLFNGLSANTNGPIDYLPNENLETNLAFSFQMFMEGNERYPNLMRPIYLKPYRFNLHLKGRSTLVELGTQYNTVEEAKNSMKYLAEILVNVLTGK